MTEDAVRSGARSVTETAATELAAAVDVPDMQESEGSGQGGVGGICNKHWHGK